MKEMNTSHFFSVLLVSLQMLVLLSAPAADRQRWELNLPQYTNICQYFNKQYADKSQTELTFDLMCVSVCLSVSLQEIEAAVGDAVILPCSHNKAVQGEVSVFWRYGDTSTVYDIINSRATDYQDESFRGRVDSFPAEWPKGNFSIRLSNVTKPDGGKYTCFIPAVHTQSSVYLSVKGV